MGSPSQHVPQPRRHPSEQKPTLPCGQHSHLLPLPRGRPQGCCFICGGRRPATASRTSSGTWEEEGSVRAQESGGGAQEWGGAQLGSPRERGAAEAVLGVFCFPALSGAAGLPAQGSPGNLPPAGGRTKGGSPSSPERSQVIPSKGGGLVGTLVPAGLAPSDGCQSPTWAVPATRLSASSLGPRDVRLGPPPPT